MRNKTVRCKKCEIEIAHWDMFSNMQFEEEYECMQTYRRKLSAESRVFKMVKGKEALQRSEIRYCSLDHNTKYCGGCARRLKYRCSRPRCKGVLRKVRNKDGSCTKYTHGGW